MSTTIAVTGAGAMTGLGAAPALWARVRAGEASGRRVPEGFLAEVPEPLRARALRCERVTQLAFAAAEPALRGAALVAADGPPRPDLGIVLGSAFGCLLTNAAYARRVAEGGLAAASPRLFAATVSNAAAGELAIAYRLGGPAVTLSAGGAAGLVALGHAVDLLRGGHATALLAGGVDALGDDVVAWMMDGGLEVEGPPGEAAALLVLEPAAGAATRGARVLGTILGHAAGFEPDPPDGRGLRGAVRAALADAALDPAAVDVVAYGGVGATGDAVWRLLAGTLGARASRIVRPKEVFGETFAAAGPLGLLAALAEAPRGAAVLVLDVCVSGHVAALAARAGADA